MLVKKIFFFDIIVLNKQIKKKEGFWMVISIGNNNLNENNKPIQEMIFLDKLKRVGSSDLNLKFISNKFNKLSRFVTWKLFEDRGFKEKIDLLFGYYILLDTKNESLVFVTKDLLDGRSNKRTKFDDCYIQLINPEELQDVLLDYLSSLFEDKILIYFKLIMFLKNRSIKRDFLSKLNSVLKEKIGRVMFGLLDDPVTYFLENKYIFSQPILTSMEFIETLGWREWLDELIGNEFTRYFVYYPRYSHSPIETAEYKFLKTYFSFNEYMNRDHNYQNIQDRINYDCIIITNCFDLLKSKLDKMRLWDIIYLIDKIKSVHYNVIRSFYSNYKNGFSIFQDNRFLLQKMSQKDFDESLAAIYIRLNEVFVNQINEMIDKAYSFDSRLKKEEDFCYIGSLANDYLNRMRENKDFLASQGLNFDLVNYNFVLDERIVELTKKHKYASLLDIEREKNLDFLKKEFSLKKF